MSSSHSLRPLLSSLHQLLAPLRRNRSMWLETLVITLVAIVLGSAVSSDDPLHVGSPFPWIWLAPILVALRYGMAAGTASSLILLATWWVNDYVSGRHADFPGQFFFGGLFVVMLCGEFSDLWETRLRRATETNHYLDERLSRITDRYLLLRLSHDRMEEEMLAKPVTLRDALRELRQLAIRNHPHHAQSAQTLLQLLTRYCQLESAAVFTVAAKGRPERVSQIGSPPDLSPDDCLLAHAMEHRSLSHLLIADLHDTKPPSPFLVVAPILTSSGQLLGVLAIERMPFLALNEENLQILAVILDYYADCVGEAEAVRQFLERLPGAPEDFAAEFSRLLKLQRNHGIDSHVVVLSFNDDEDGRKAVTQLVHGKRATDMIWQMTVGKRLILANLMPLARQSAAEEYLVRIENMLKEHLGVVHQQGWYLDAVKISLSESDPANSLRHACKDISA